ncbi:MAG: S1 RNA-binding domain-containing protein [Armatimonadota bacterium]|nr:S1 RNA-binding domain-containing protein [Armatimonadota bacterium]MDR7427906.1 S1 RNA-binding domain-containing protein [Armatimonadota bacterium]MDR7464032.1 S1 RNA-binding domain-containing protein [Armatimonadota bacterium]MDR7471109.1 S1 RNA-binding domain-containing protein [Armatimonadota bacterium]MDR7476099.1 S1 RNA-binding domain-containing protein [Armatimonadota bacterium]
MAEQSRPEEEQREGVDLAQAITTLQERQIVKGTVVRVDSEGVLVDVGAKSEGLIPPRELARRGEGPEELHVGDRIDVMVMRVEGEEGNILLSKKRADFQRAWERIVEAHRSGKILHAMVVDKVKGGLVVDLGVRGFVPGSHVDLSQAKGRRFEWFVGQSLPLKVIEVDRAKARVILSHRLAAEEERARRKETLLATLEEGQVVEGTVKRITDFGAFVDLGGVDGLLPISEMAWMYVKHPSEVVRRNQRLRLMVLRVDREGGKISLGLKQLLDDPWQEVPHRYSVGELVRGKIVRLVPSGAFMRLRDREIDAFIPISELAEKRVAKVEDAVQPGQSVEAIITEIRAEERRMIVSLRRAARERERRRVRDYMQNQEDGGRVTIGDVAGELLRQVVERPKAAEPEPPAGSSPPEGGRGAEE